MLKLLVLGFSLTLLACTALMSHEPVSRSLIVQESPDAAYGRATRAMARLGGEITQANTQTRTLSARVHNAVVMTVLVEPTGEGASIEAVCTLLPNKLAVGTLDECDTFTALLR